MRKFLAVIFLLGFANLAYAHGVFDFNTANSRLNSTANPMVVLIGDSNVYRAPSTFSVPGYNLVKWAVNGINSKDIVRGLPLIAWVKTPAICAVIDGTNDAYGQNNAPEIQPSYYKINLKMAVLMLKARCDRVILFSPPPTRDRVNISAWVTAAQEAAAEMDVQYFPLTETMFPPSAFGDDVHFNASGYAILQQAMIDAIAAN